MSGLFEFHALPSLEPIEFQLAYGRALGGPNAFNHYGRMGRGRRHAVWVGQARGGGREASNRSSSHGLTDKDEG
jgi:hypothetical protein